LVAPVTALGWDAGLHQRGDVVGGDVSRAYAPGQVFGSTVVWIVVFVKHRSADDAARWPTQEGARNYFV
jgi:hypothetical protein